MKRGLIISVCVCLSSILQAQILYDFEANLDGWIQKPANSWTRTMSNNYVLSGTASLRHDRTGANTDSIFIPISGIAFENHDITWKFLLRHGYNPSGTNKWAVILAANSTANQFSGYAVGVNMKTGTTDDLLCLYQVNAGVFSEICKTNINWQDLVGIGRAEAVEIRRDEHGIWTIGSGENFSSISFYAQTISNTAYSDISFFGILFVYTSTAAKLLSVDDISIEAVDKIIKESDTEIILPDSQITGDDISSTSWDTINALKFSIQDVDITDNFPTYLQQIVVRNPQPAASSIWEKTIANAWLYNGDLQINSNVLIKNDSITFLFPNNLFIPSGEVVNLLMKISLTDSLTDNSTLQFKIDKNNHGCRASANGSGILPVLVNDIVSGIFTIRVDADTILLKDLPQQIVINSSFSISAIASDSLGNVDTDFSPSANLVLVSGSGNLIIEPISFQSGILIAENIKYNKAENILLKLSTTILSSTNASISVILDTTSIIEPPNSQYVGITIPSDAVSMETEMAVFKFIIKDIAGDGAPTIVEELRFENPLSATNLINVIGGISLYDGSRRLVTNILEQKREFMRIGLFAGTLAIEDGESKEITMKIHLKTKVADKTGLKFLIYSINHGSKASQNGSQFAGNFGQNIVSEDFTVEVDAKKLIFKTIPAAVVHGQAFGVEINAVSDDGTIDVDVTGNITLELIENEELLTCSSGLTKQMADGKAVWNDLIISSPVVFHIKAKHSALTLTETVSSDIAAMDLDSEILPVISQNRTIFKSTDTGAIVAKEVIRLILSDKGTRDGLPLIVDKMFFYSVSDFSILNATGGIELIVDNQNIPVTYSLTENKIQINPENLQIPDGGTKEIYLKIFLRGAKYRDGAKFQIYIPATNHGWTTKENSSQFAKTFNYSIYSEEHCIDVEAFGLIAVNQPVIVEKNQPFRIVVAAADCFGNIDTAFNHNIEIVQNTGAGYIHVIDTEQTKGVKTFELAYDSLNEFSLKSTTSLLEEVMFVPISAVNKIDTLVKQNITTWNNIGDWVWNGNKLKHNTGTGLSQVSAPINIDISNGMVQWDFELENGNFDPSADNAFCCVLSSDIEHFATNNFSGYLIGVNQTGASDLISFWKVKNGAKTILWSSNYDWNANTAVQIIVQRHEGEKWTIFIKEIGKSLQLAGTFTDKEFVDCKFSGFLFNYTTTRVGMLSINNYELTKINLPLKLNQAEILDKNSIRLVFNTNIDFSDALNFENYFLKSNLDTFAIIDAEQISDREIRLSTAMLSDTVFYLAISGIRDNAGIALKDTVLKLTRIAPNVNCVAKILNRSNLSLVFNTALVDTTSLKTANYKLINFENITFEIKNITKNFDTLYLVCDSLYGSGFMLHYNNLMTADAFVLNDSVLLTKEYLPAKIVKIEVNSSKNIVIEFSKNIVEAGNYLVKNTKNKTFNPISNVVNNKRVSLNFSESLSGNNFVAYVLEVKDNEEFIINDSARFNCQTVNFGDLIFSEIMAKPNPPVGLPNREYVELHNRTDDSLDLTNFRILYGSSNSSRITGGKIAPNGYIVVCASSSLSELSQFGDVVSATSFPSLLDAGMMLTLVSPDTVVTAVTEYNSSFYGDAEKAKGGWSLERIDANNLSDNGNWTVSNDASGGTPCRENSVTESNPDNETPYVEKVEISGANSLIITLNERIDRDILANSTNYFIAELDISAINLGDDKYLKTIEVLYSEDFEPDKVYSLKIKDIQDIAGNTISDTIIYVFIESPKILISKISKIDEIQLIFSESMIVADAQNLTNYKLVSSVNTEIEIVSLILETTKRKELTVKTGTLSDTVLKLNVFGLQDSRGYLLRDTIVELRRVKPLIDFKLESSNRNLLSLIFNVDMNDSTILKHGNYQLYNSDKKVFTINNIQKTNPRKIDIICDSLYGSGFMLHYNNLMTADAFVLNDSILLTKEYLPAKIVKIEVNSSKNIVIEFSKNIVEAGNYLVKNTKNQIFTPISNVVNNKRVSLNFSESLSGNNFVAHVLEVKDNDEFMINDSARFNCQTVNFGDLIFSEIMAKPNPPVGLPNREYVELHNRTDDSLDLTNFRILYGSSSSSRITGGKIAPNGYIVVCASSSLSELSQFGDVVSATSFPSLLDAGMMLTLVSPDTVVTAVTEYNSSFYGDAEKAKGGWSLERIDANNLSDNGNWTVSNDASGGTPCRENSVTESKPDKETPYVEKVEISGANSLIITLNERIERDILANPTNYFIAELDISAINLTDDKYLKTTELLYSEDFEPDRVYSLKIKDIQDIAGNTISDTIIYVFIESPKILISKISKIDEIQLIFSESMIVADAQNLTNYKLVSSVNTEIEIVSLILETTKRKELTVKTGTLSDTVLKLNVFGLRDSRGYLLRDTIVELRRVKPLIDFKLESSNRNLLSLIFNVDMNDSTILKHGNYQLYNSDKKVFTINNIQKTNPRKIDIICDSLYGSGFMLHYNNLMTADAFVLNDSVLLTKEYLPAKIVKIEVNSSKNIVIEFSKNIVEAGNYLVKNTKNQTFNPISNVVNNKRVSLNFSESLSGNNFVAYVLEVKDNEEFIINDSARFNYQTVNFGDLIFSEIMAKPNPPVGLPNREYVELHNRTDDSLDLTNFRILYGSSSSSRITGGKIAPNGYIVVCASSSLSELSQFGDVVSATSFPSLLDAGMMLTLVSPDTVVTAVTEYNSSFYGDAEKAKGGWSLERIDANNLSDNGNWMVSNDANGGTPCRENSVTESKPDNIPPYVVTVEMTGDNSILLIFNEFIPFSLLQQANSFTVKNLGTPIKSTPTHIEFANQTELIFDKPFEIGVVYELSISLEIKDIHRNEYVNEPIIFGKMHKPQQNDLVINEILFNPHSGAQDFVEIYNKSDKIFDIADLAIASRNRTTGNLQQIHKISDYHRYIYPEEYFVLTVDSVLEQFYYAENPENIIIMNAFPVYPNDNGTCVLLVSEAEIVDEFSYSEKMHNVFISNKQGVSLERVDYNRPAAESTNWQSAAQTAGFATPTYKNSAYFLSENTDNDAFNLSSTTFSPDGDGYEDVLYIDYKMPEANYVASIRVYNIRGNFVKEICRNVTLGVEGRLEWNGSQANNSRSPVGPYIIFIEAFNQNGSVLKYKKICVLAEK